jgi:hypothetical protein
MAQIFLCDFCGDKAEKMPGRSDTDSDMARVFIFYDNNGYSTSSKYEFCTNCKWKILEFLKKLKVA